MCESLELRICCRTRITLTANKLSISPAYGGNPEILEKLDFSRINRFREARDISLN